MLAVDTMILVCCAVRSSVNSTSTPAVYNIKLERAVNVFHGPVYKHIGSGSYNSILRVSLGVVATPPFKSGGIWGIITFIMIQKRG